MLIQDVDGIKGQQRAIHHAARTARDSAIRVSAVTRIATLHWPRASPRTRQCGISAID
jgi:hypothetical protein